MRYVEFKKAIKNIGEKYNINLKVEKSIDETYVYLIEEDVWTIATVDNQFRYKVDTNYGLMVGLEEHIRGEIFQAITKFANTPIEDRGYEKRFIVPLPNLVTTDGEQQYLTHNGSFFASRRDESLRQTWREEDLVHVPECYRQYAIEWEGQ